jgi:hypothetical protein
MARHTALRSGVGILSLLAIVGLAPTDALAGWKAGTARVAITPKQPTWMAGYAARKGPSDGAVHDLWARALVLEDGAGKKAVLVTLDLVGIGRDLSVPICDAIRDRLKIGRDQVVLACSHTHCGPIVGENERPMFNLDADQWQRVAAYAAFLKASVISVVDDAAERLEPVELAWDTGRADFAVNRRTNKEPDVPALRSKLALAGPVDHDVPVLRARGADGALRAVVFGYACHCTVLSFNKFCGDYAGFAQLALEAAHPGAQAMFVAGCGADQNPLPRRTLELAQAYGRQLATAVDRVLARPMEAVADRIACAYTEIPLAFGTLPTKQQVQDDAKSADTFVASRARYLLKTIDRDGRLSPTYPYPVQVWRIGELTWVLLGGEVVVDYSLRLKRNLGSSHTWVSAYCNDVMAYIPSLRVLKEGGYEGATAMIYYGLPAPWSERVEDDVVGAVVRLIDRP